MTDQECFLLLAYLAQGLPAGAPDPNDMREDSLARKVWIPRLAALDAIPARRAADRLMDKRTDRFFPSPGEFLAEYRRAAGITHVPNYPALPAPQPKPDAEKFAAFIEECSEKLRQAAINVEARKIAKSRSGVQ